MKFSNSPKEVSRINAIIAFNRINHQLKDTPERLKKNLSINKAIIAAK